MLVDVCLVHSGTTCHTVKPPLLLSSANKSGHNRIGSAYVT